MNKVYLDTNVIIRLLTKDKAHQYQQAKKVFKRIEKGKIKAYLSILVVNEIIWIAENFYNLERDQYLPILLKLFSLKQIKCIEIKKAWLLDLLKNLIKKKVDFTDFYLSKICAKGEKVASFDHDFKSLGVKTLRLSNG